MWDKFYTIIVYIVINLLITLLKDAELIRLVFGVNSLITFLINLGFSEKLNVDLKSLDFNINYLCIDFTIVYAIINMCRV